MASTEFTLKNEEKNKKRGITYSIILHLALLLIALWPLMDKSADLEKNFAILVEFEKPKIVPKKLGGGPKSAKSSEGAASETAPKNKVEDKTPEKQPQRKKITKVIHIDNTTPRKPKSKPIERVLTTPDIQTPEYPEPVETPDRIETQTNPSKIPTNSSNEPTSLEDFLPEIDKIIEEEKNTGATSGSGGQGDDSNPERGDGKGGKGKGDGIGDKDNGGKAAGSGTGDDDLPPGEEGDGTGNGPYRGEGPLTRRIKKRADFRDLNLKSGYVIIELCINQAGKITYARGSVRKSTVKSRKLVRDFTRNFKENTIFFVDKNAPYKECGTYKYKIDNPY